MNETARRCFLEHGPGLSVGTIAAELGISDAAILKRVGSKEQLLRNCLMSVTPMPWLHEMRSGPKAGPLSIQLESLLTGISATVKDRVPSLIAIRLSDIDMVDFIGPDVHKAPPMMVRKELAMWLSRARATHGLKLDDTAAAAELLISAAQSRAFHHWISSGLFPEANWSDLVKAVLDRHMD